MGRAIVRQPQAFLMDEPLSNLDAKLRVQMRADISQLQRDLKVTTVYVTHDQVEAMTMGERVAVMRKGELQQVATPQELYDQPVNLFVGGFIGSPAMNMLEATIEQSNGDLAARVGEYTLKLDPELVTTRSALKSYVGKSVIIGIRPEDLEDAALARDIPEGNHLNGMVKLREALGSEIMVHAEIQAQKAVTDDVKELAEDVGDERLMHSGSTAPIVGRFNSRSRVRVGEAVDIAVDTRTTHFFDRDTGRGIYDAAAQANGGQG
jgi:multiple sugar transport system ATP-binding protein